jgi:uncharacterized protein (DUF1778 family)
VSDFMRSKALDTAELEMIERRVVTIPAKDWKKFVAWADRPAVEIQGLRDLVGKAPTWQSFLEANDCNRLSPNSAAAHDRS